MSHFVVDNALWRIAPFWIKPTPFAINNRFKQIVVSFYAIILLISGAPFEGTWLVEPEGCC